MPGRCGLTHEQAMGLGKSVIMDSSVVKKKVFAGYDCVFGRGRLADMYVFNEADGKKLMNKLFLIVDEDVYSFSKGVKGDYISMHVENSSVYVEPRNRGAKRDVVMEIVNVFEDCRDAAREKLEGLVNK